MDDPTELPAGKARISLNGEFSALEIEDIIAELAKVRAGLEPSVPVEPPTAMAQEVLVQEETLFKIRTLVAGGVRIWLRNEGLGWLAFTLKPTDVLGLREFLGKKLGHSHTAH